MKRFAFALEKVLELRKYYEQEAKVELGRAISVLTEIENNIKTNALLRSRAASERFSVIGPTENGGAISMFDWDNYILRLEQEAQRLAEEAIKAEAVVEEKRNIYLEASRELKVMEKLKEKRQKEYREEVFAAETSERDDTWRAKALDA
jgi:flagellar FliJ protein